MGHSVRLFPPAWRPFMLLLSTFYIQSSQSKSQSYILRQNTVFESSANTGMDEEQRNITGGEDKTQVNNEVKKYCKEDSDCDSPFEWCDKTIHKVFGTCSYTQGFYVGLVIIILITITIIIIIFFLYRRKTRNYSRSRTEEDERQENTTRTDLVVGRSPANTRHQMREKEKPRGVLYSR